MILIFSPPDALSSGEQCNTKFWFPSPWKWSSNETLSREVGGDQCNIQEKSSKATFYLSRKFRVLPVSAIN